MTTIRRLGPPRDSAPVALVLPGAGYTAQAPLLWWPAAALRESGYEVWGVDWHDDATAGVGDPHDFVDAHVARALEALPAQPVVVLAKSLGTFALPRFARTGVRAAWLTPILTDERVATALRGASSDHLTVGGGADPTWVPSTVAGTQALSIEVPGADHVLEEGGWRASALSQAAVVESVVAHLLSAG